MELPGCGGNFRFAEADLVSSLKLHYPRSHPAPMECCGSIADFDRSTSKLTFYVTSQAPHIVRAAVALVAELPEHLIRIISPDLGGGFGNKVPVYPGYVMSILASILTRGARFFIVAALLRSYGPSIRAFIERRLTLVTSAFAGLVVLGFLSLRYL